MTGDVSFTAAGAAGIIQLNRPGALNALTHAMATAIDGQLAAWADMPAISRVIISGAGDKAFCAGGDVRALYDSGQAKDGAGLQFWHDEYLLNARIKHYPKPYIALMDGITMGGGVGLSLHGSHRVVTERTVFAMPETGIGLFPDVGGTYFLPRLPGRTGLYLGLTGARLKAADCLYAGIASHYVPAARIEALIAALSAGGAPDEVLPLFAADPGPAPLAARQDFITRHFSAGRVEEILSTLNADPDPLAAETAKQLAQKSPTSLKVTFRQLTEGAALDFDAAMRLEYRLTHGFYGGHDFYEGVRAIIIDKDNAPRWNPERLDQVTDAMIEAYFAAPPGGDLPL